MIDQRGVKSPHVFGETRRYSSVVQLAHRGGHYYRGPDAGRIADLLRSAPEFANAEIIHALLTLLRGRRNVLSVRLATFSVACSISHTVYGGAHDIYGCALND